MMINGAQAMVECLKKEGVSVMFGYPGAVICPFYDAVYEDGSISHVLVRQEQNAGHEASGYARISGKVGVCVVTSGPGATNLITAIATAYLDSVPIVAITGQVRRDQLGKDVFQEVDITGSVEPFVKHSYLIKDANEIPRIFKEAFHIASTGRPGPVLIDVPMDVQLDELDNFEYPEKVNIIGYKPSTKGNPLQVKKALSVIEGAKKPVICIGGGIINAKACDELRAFAEKTGIPVVSTMMGLSAMPSNHDSFIGMIGMHGTPAANKAVSNADTVIIIGARVGDRAVKSPQAVFEGAKIVHIDVDPAEIGKNVKVFVPIVGDAKIILSEISDKCDYVCPDEWKEEVKEYKREYKRNLESRADIEGFVNPVKFLKALSDKMPEDSVVAADVGQNQIWTCNHFEVKEGRLLNSGGMGTMGYSVGAAIGAKLAKPDVPVVAICGDGSFQMQMMELATLVQHGIDVKIVIMRNKNLGMIREIQKNLYKSRHIASNLDGSPDFVALANAYGIPARSIGSNDEIEGAVNELLAAKGPYLLQCMVSSEQPSL
ncbi:MAG: biosynthetic-type acetolactate synthase large subunit [Clostridia bacterium]|nr:biosynthetic-type acetolactate synthase large subunit [Clostridia bacterium]